MQMLSRIQRSDPAAALLTICANIILAQGTYLVDAWWDGDDLARYP